MTKTLLALNGLLAPEMEILEQHFSVLRLWQEKDPETALQQHKSNIVAILSRADKQPVSQRMIEALPNLEIIAQFGTGIDNIDVETAVARGISITNTPDVMSTDVADIAMALILSAARRVCEADMFVRCGRWQDDNIFPMGTSLGDKTLGIVGLGRIGQAIAKRAEAFNMEVLYHGPHEKTDQPYPYCADLEKMAALSDFLVAACPGGDETTHLIDGRILKALGSSGYLINVARGSVVDESALLAALYNKNIAGAGLDVYESEPSVPEGFFGMDNVVLLPHIGYATKEARQAMGRLVVENLLAYFEGRALKTRIA